MWIPKEFLEVVDFVASQPSRYAINGVKVARRADDGMCELVATNGRRMILVEWNDEDEARGHPIAKRRCLGFSAVIPADAMMEAKKLAPNQTTKEVLKGVVLTEPGALAGDEDAGTATELEFAATDQAMTRTLSVTPVDHNFPNHVGVVPTKKPAEVVSICVRVDLLTDTLKTLARILTEEDDSVFLTVPYNGKTPLLIEWTGNHLGRRKVRAVVMSHKGADPELAPAVCQPSLGANKIGGLLSHVGSLVSLMHECLDDEKWAALAPSKNPVVRALLQNIGNEAAKFEGFESREEREAAESGDDVSDATEAVNEREGVEVQTHHGDVSEGG